MVKINDVINNSGKSVLDTLYIRKYLPQIGTFIVLKVTQACNLRCKYCYSCGGETNNRMNIELA